MAATVKSMGVPVPDTDIVSNEESKAIRNSMGMMEYQQQGQTFIRPAWADCLHSHQYIIETVASMNPSEQGAYSNVLASVGGGDIESLSLNRPLKRANYQIVLE